MQRSRLLLMNINFKESEILWSLGFAQEAQNQMAVKVIHRSSSQVCRPRLGFVASVFILCANLVLNFTVRDKLF